MNEALYIPEPHSPADSLQSLFKIITNVEPLRLLLSKTRVESSPRHQMSESDLVYSVVLSTESVKFRQIWFLAVAK